MPLNLDYFYGGESEQYSFYRIPKVLFTAAHYRAVPVEAKVLYGLLLDRMALSARNGWLDEGRRVFIYFTLEDAMAMMGCGHNKAVRLFADLEHIGLIERRKQGQGRPTRIYVKNFILSTETGEPEEEPATPQPPAIGQTSEYGKSEEAPEVLTSQNRKSALPETGSPDFPKANANKTDKNNTELNDTDLSIPPSPPKAKPPRMRRQRMRMDEMDSYRELIQENISYDLLLQENPYDDELIDGYVELMVDVCCSKRSSTHADGTRTLNQKETTIAQQKQEAICQAFKDWIFKDPERRADLCATYNRIFNSTRPREYNGDHIRFTGMNPEIKLEPHQRNAVARMLYGGNALQIGRAHV